MHYNISFNEPNIWNLENRTGGSVRVLHAVPDAPNVDVYANDKLLVRNLSYSQYSKYISVPVGNYEISIYATGSKDTPVLRNMLMVNQNSIQTVAAVGTVSTIGLLAIPDNMKPIESGESMIRFSHLSPNAPAVDITLPNGTMIFNNVSYKQLTPYVEVSPMNYTLQVRLAGTSTVVLTVPNVNLEPNKSYTIYAIGLVGEVPELEALLVPDGNNYNTSF